MADSLVIDKRLLNKPPEKYWITYIKQRIKKNKNFVGFLSGPTGSGKTFSCLAIAEMLDEDFNIDRVVFSGLELMTLINNGNLKSGDVVVFEESGVALSNKNWYSVTNKMISYLFQTFRHRNFILLMNSPYMDFVDSSTRRLFHAEISTVGILRDTNQCKLKPRLLQYNSRNQKMYYKMLRVVTPLGTKPVCFWSVPKPSDKLIEQYELKKRQYTDNLNEEIMEALTKEQEKKQSKKELTQLQKQILDELVSGKRIPEIAIEHGVTDRAIHSSVSQLKRRGYRIEPILEGSHVLRYNVIAPENGNDSHIQGTHVPN